MNAFLARRKEFFVEVYTVKRETIEIWKNQTIKNHIERMSISGSEKYRLLAITPCIEEYKHCEMVTTKTTEQNLIQPCKAKDDLKVESNIEPVYAVVNMQNKYDQRKKRSMMMEEKHCSSYESICRFEENKMNGKEKSLESLVDTVYEDGDMFCNRGADGKFSMGNSSNQSEGEDNIYEPINVKKTSKFEFRKYISRLKLNPFLRAKNNIFDMKLPNANGAMSRFSTFRCKLGKHRKSVQKRMRNLYSNGYEPNPLFHHEKTPPLPLDILRPIKSIELDYCKDKKPKDTEIRSNDDTCIEEVTQKIDSIPTFRKAVSKISLFNITSISGSLNLNS